MPFLGKQTEQERQDEFEDLCGGMAKAERLMKVWNDSYPTGMKHSRYYHSREDNFRARAKGWGYTDCQIDMFMTL